VGINALSYFFKRYSVKDKNKLFWQAAVAACDSALEELTARSGDADDSRLSDLHTQSRQRFISRLARNGPVA
jgi:hypothetical protein